MDKGKRSSSPRCGRPMTASKRPDAVGGHVIRGASSPESAAATLRSWGRPPASRAWVATAYSTTGLQSRSIVETFPGCVIHWRFDHVRPSLVGLAIRSFGFPWSSVLTFEPTVCSLFLHFLFKICQRKPLQKWFLSCHWDFLKFRSTNKGEPQFLKIQLVTIALFLMKSTMSYCTFFLTNVVTLFLHRWDIKK
jgi:hypothetical protein